MMSPLPAIWDKLTLEQQKRYLEDLELWSKEESEFAKEKARLRYLPKKQRSHSTMPMLSDADEDDWE